MKRIFTLTLCNLFSLAIIASYIFYFHAKSNLRIDADLKSATQRLEANWQNQVKVALLVFLKDQVNQKDYALQQREIVNHLKSQHIQHVQLSFVNAIAISIPTSRADKLFNQLRRFPQVAKVSLVKSGTMENERAVASNRDFMQGDPAFDVSTWWNAGYAGQKGIVGILDSGIASEHRAFHGKTVISNYDSRHLSQQYINGVRTAHGTGVACIYAGNINKRYRGIAYQANTIVSSYAGDKDSEGNQADGILLTLRGLDWLATQQEVTPDTINYSFGNGLIGSQIDTDWSALAMVIDKLVSTSHIHWIKSAGNYGWISQSKKSPYRSSLTIPADNYNGITVANMNPYDPETNQLLERPRHSISVKSSRGPTASGRRKPDLSAAGNNTFTCAPEQQRYYHSSNKKFRNYTARQQYDDKLHMRLMGGTSAAAPKVGAATLLFKDAGITDPMLVKATLINSADAWSDGNGNRGPNDKNYPCLDPEANCGHGPIKGSNWNPTYGWGYINMNQAFIQLANGKLTQIGPGEKHRYQAQLLPNDKITLVWQRRVGFDDDNRMWELTKLRLRLYNQDGHLLTEDPSEIDNVLQVAMPATDTKEPQPVIVEVSAVDKPIDGVDFEPYALSASKPLLKNT